MHARREEARKQRIVPRNVDPPRRRGIRKEAPEGVDVQKKAQLEASPLNVNKAAERGEMERKI